MGEFSDRQIGQLLRQGAQQLENDLKLFQNEALRVVEADRQILVLRQKLTASEDTVGVLDSRVDRLEEAYRSLLASQDETIRQFEEMERRLQMEIQSKAAGHPHGLQEDRDREDAYQRALTVSQHLDSVSRDIEQLVSHLNAQLSSVAGSRGSPGLAASASSPVWQIVSIMDGQLRQLQMLSVDVGDVETQILQTRGMLASKRQTFF